MQVYTLKIFVPLTNSKRDEIEAFEAGLRQNAHEFANLVSLLIDGELVFKLLHEDSRLEAREIDMGLEDSDPA